MVLAKQILKALNDKGQLDKFSIYIETGDDKTPDRLAFLSENGYINITSNNEFSLTERGQQLLTKI